jgi:hypothetical protein
MGLVRISVYRNKCTNCFILYVLMSQSHWKYFDKILCLGGGPCIAEVRTGQPNNYMFVMEWNRVHCY